MASFVEFATLKLVDQTSGPAQTIRAALKGLFADASKLKNVDIKIKVSAPGLTQTTAQFKTATAAANAFAAAADRAAKASGKRAIALNVNPAPIAGLRAMTTAINAYNRAVAAVPPNPVIAPRTRGSGVPNSPGVARSLPAPGVGGGALNPASGLHYGFSTLTVAALAAASALKSIVSNSADSNRTALQTNVQASAAQRAIIAEQGGRPANAGAITMTNTERTQLTTSVLGDVQGNETERARNAVSLVKKLEAEVLPRLFAQSPGKSREEVIGGLRKIVQAMNLASTDVMDSKGNFTPDGERALRGIQLAMAADPDLTPLQIRTALANAKTAGLTLTPEAMATMLVNVGNRGQRAANETFQAMRGPSGGVDIKALNNSLAAMGLLTDVKRNPKGNVITGSGTPVDQRLLNTDPSMWFQKNYVPLMEKAIKARGEDPKDSAIIKAQIEKDFPALRSAGQLGIFELVTGFAQAQAAIAQARLGMDQPVNPAIEAAWTAQAANVGTAFKDAAAKVGESFMQSIGGAGILKGIANVLRGEAGTAAQGAALGAGAAGIGLASVVGLRALFGGGASLLLAGTSLQASAAALTAAAGVQAGAKGLGAAAGAVGGAGAAAAAGAASKSPGLLVSAAAALAATGAVAYIAGIASDNWTKRNQTPEEKKADKAADIASTISTAQMAKDLLGGLFDKLGINTTGTKPESQNMQLPKDSDRAQYIQQLTAEIAALSSKIENNKANEKLPGTAIAANMGLESKKASLQEELAALTGSAETFKTTFATGATALAAIPGEYAATFTSGSETLKQVGPVIDTAATNFGPTAGNGIVAFAGQFGAIAGQAIAAAASAISINLKAPEGATNTGRSRPQE